MENRKRNYGDETISEKQAIAAPADKSRILVNMRHDIRSPMHVVKGLTSVLAASDPLTPQQKEVVTTLKSNVDHLFVLIDNMLDYLQVVTDDADKGSTFASVSPRKSLMQENIKVDKESSAQASHGKEEASNARRRILLVEDYDPTILMMSKFLKELGYEFETARTGREALEKYSYGSYDFVLMDLQLPDIDGFEITRRIRIMEKEKGLPSVPVIATSGMDDDRRFCLRAGMNDCLTKPFGLEELEAKLLKYGLSKEDEVSRRYFAEAGASWESDGGRI